MWSSDHKETAAVTLTIQWVVFYFYLCFSPGTRDSLWLPCSRVLNALQVLEENKTVLQKRQPYHKLYLFTPLPPLLLSSPSSPQHTPFRCVSPWVFGSAQFPQSPSLNWSSFLFLYFGVSAISFSATLHFHFPFCELTRLGSTCWCQMYCMSNVSAINS